MDDLSSLLSSLTPDDINTLKSAASQLLGNNPQAPAPERPASAENPSTGTPDLGALLRSLGVQQPAQPAEEKPGSELGIDPAMIANIARIFGQINQTDDKRIQFIAALRPLLNSSRQKKADQAIKMLKLFEILPLLKEQGLLNLL